MLGYAMFGTGGGDDSGLTTYTDLTKRVVINTNSTSIRSVLPTPVTTRTSYSWAILTPSILTDTTYSIAQIRFTCNIYVTMPI